jgi:hypothetical protein
LVLCYNLIEPKASSFIVSRKGQNIKFTVKILIFGTFAAGLAAGLKYFQLNNEIDQVQLSPEKQIAYIKDFANDARWKSVRLVTWKPIRKNFFLGSGDALYSGENSKIDLVFKNKNKMQIQSNTLISISSPDKSAAKESSPVEMNLSYGNLSLTSLEKSKWKIKSHGEQLEINSGGATQTDVRIPSNKTFEVTLKRGQAEVQQSGQPRKIMSQGKSEVFRSLAAGENQKSPNRLDGKKVAALALKDSLNTPLTGTQNASKLDARNSASKNNSLHKNESAEDRLNKLAVNTNSPPPTLKVPFHENIVYVYKGSKLTVHFVWSDSTNTAKSFVIEVADNDLFRSPLVKMSSTAATLDLELPKLGKLYWRVKSLYSEDSSPWSEVNIFTLAYSD